MLKGEKIREIYFKILAESEQTQKMIEKFSSKFENSPSVPKKVSPKIEISNKDTKCRKDKLKVNRELLQVLLQDHRFRKELEVQLDKNVSLNFKKVGVFSEENKFKHEECFLEMKKRLKQLKANSDKYQVEKLLDYLYSLQNSSQY